MRSIVVLLILTLSVVLAADLPMINRLAARGQPAKMPTELLNVLHGMDSTVLRNERALDRCRARMIEEVKRDFFALNDYVTAKNIPKILQGYANNTVVAIGEPGATFYVGRDVWRDQFLIPTLETGSFVSDVVPVQYLASCPDRVLGYGQYPSTFTPNGMDPIHFLFDTLVVFERNSEYIRCRKRRRSCQCAHLPKWVIAAEVSLGLPVS